MPKNIVLEKKVRSEHINFLRSFNLKMFKCTIPNKLLNFQILELDIGPEMFCGKIKNLKKNRIDFNNKSFYDYLDDHQVLGVNLTTIPFLRFHPEWVENGSY